MRARAAVMYATGQPLELDEVEVLPPQAGEVLVRYIASGVCHSDLHVIQGLTAHPTPVVLGHEGAGVVEAVGAGVSSVQVGDHVLTSYVPSCGRCPWCVVGRPNMCDLRDQPRYLMHDGTSRFRKGNDAILSLFAGLVVRRESGPARAKRGAHPQGRAARRHLSGQLWCDDRRRRGDQSRQGHARLERRGLWMRRGRAERGPGGSADGRWQSDRRRRVRSQAGMVEGVRRDAHRERADDGRGRAHSRDLRARRRRLRDRSHRRRADHRASVPQRPSRRDRRGHWRLTGRDEDPDRSANALAGAHSDRHIVRQLAPESRFAA